MKKIILMSLLGLMVGSTACEDNKDEFLSDYATTMYFRNSGEQKVTCYITGEDTKYNLSVVKAGNDEKALSDAEVSVMDAAQLAVYNSENGTNYEMLPSNCYEFSTATDLTFAADDAYKLVGVNLKPSNVKELDKDNYVLPLVLTSSKQVNEEKNVVFVKPIAVTPTLSMKINESDAHTISKNGAVISVPLQLQIDNQWDFQAKVVVDESETTLDLASFTLANDGIVDFVAGGNGTLDINISALNQVSGKIALKIESIIGKEFDFDSNVYSIDCVTEAYPLTASMLSSNAVEPSEGSLANLLDNNVNTYFHSAWSVAVSGAHYVQVNLPENVKKFGFSYTNRSSNGNASLAWFNVYGGTDNENLEVVKFYSWDGDGLPSGAAGKFVSGILEVDKPVNVLRFELYNTNWTGGAFFVWSEFKLYVLE